MKPLSSAMQIVLARLRAGEIAYWMPYMGRFGGGYWYMSGGMGRVTKQVEALRARGMVVYKGGDRPGGEGRRAVLATPDKGGAA